MLVAVSFHYLCADPYSSRGAIYPVSVDAFARQIDELGRSFEFASRDQLLAAVEGRQPLPDRACVVTFDDGLRTQVELALPILQERGVPALFFVCGEPLERRNVLFVHKVHQLREQIPHDELRAALDAEFAREGIVLEHISPEAAAATYRYDTPEVAELKYALNVVVGPTRPAAVDRLFAAFFSESDLSERLYVTREHVAELEACGFLGAHGYSHRPLAVLGRDEARRDLERGVGVLEAITGRRPRAVSYPYGAPAAVDAGVALAAADNGFAYGFTMERAVNRTLEEPLLLARLDTNDAPGGRSPLLDIGQHTVEVRDGMTAQRLRYLAEEAA